MRRKKEKQPADDRGAVTAPVSVSTDQLGQSPDQPQVSPPDTARETARDAGCFPHPTSADAATSPAASVPALAGGGSTPSKYALAKQHKKDVAKARLAADRAREKLIATDGRYNQYRKIKQPTMEQIDDFLVAFLTLTHADALDKAGLTWNQLTFTRFNDPEFIKAYDEVKKFRTMMTEMKTEDRIEDIALNGFDVPVFFEGAVCGHRNCYDIKAIEMLAHKHMPGVYNPVPSSSMSVSMRHGADGEGRTLDEIIVAVENRVTKQVTSGAPGVALEKKE